jgi:hypothetical protein
MYGYKMARSCDSLAQGLGPYGNAIKDIEDDVKKIAKRVNDLTGTLSFFRRLYLTLF